MTLDPVEEQPEDLGLVEQEVSCGEESEVVYASFLNLIAPIGDKQPVEEVPCRTIRDGVAEEFKKFLKQGADDESLGELWFQWWLKIVCAIESNGSVIGSCVGCEKAFNSSGAGGGALGCYQVTKGMADGIANELCAAYRNPGLREQWGITRQETKAWCKALREIISKSWNGKPRSISKADAELIIKLWILRYRTVGPNFQRQEGESFENWWKRIYVGDPRYVGDPQGRGIGYGDPANREKKWKEVNPKPAFPVWPPNPPPPTPPK
jgi:hypothetical protein